MKKISILIIIILVVAGVFLFVKNKQPHSPTITPSPSDDVSTADIAKAIKEAEAKQPPRLGKSPTESEIYSSPYVKYIRTALNRYLNGNNEGIDDLGLNEDMPDCGLEKFDKAYYKSKFIVLIAKDNDYGGVQADIVFVDKPDTIFWAWVYKLADESYTLRGFCSNGPNEDKKADFPDYIKTVIKESKFTL